MTIPLPGGSGCLHKIFTDFCGYTTTTNTKNNDNDNKEEDDNNEDEEEYEDNNEDKEEEKEEDGRWEEKGAKDEGKQAQRPTN